MSRDSSSGSESTGPSTDGPGESSVGRNTAENLEIPRHRMPARPHPGVLTQKDLDRAETAVVAGFESGNPHEAWQATRDLIQISKRAVREAAQSRFKANFGTSRCDTCEGLSAGPDVIATCFQMKECYYSNLKSQDQTSKQQKIAERLHSTT